MILRDVNRTDSGALSQLINLMDSFIRSRLAVNGQRQARLSNGLLCGIKIIRREIGVKLRRNQFRKLMFIIMPTFAQISSAKLILKFKLN